MEDKTIAEDPVSDTVNTPEPDNASAGLFKEDPRKELSGTAPSLSAESETEETAAGATTAIPDAEEDIFADETAEPKAGEDVFAGETAEPEAGEDVFADETVESAAGKEETGSVKNDPAPLTGKKSGKGSSKKAKRKPKGSDTGNTKNDPAPLTGKKSGKGSSKKAGRKPKGSDTDSASADGTPFEEREVVNLLPRLISVLLLAAVFAVSAFTGGISFRSQSKETVICSYAMVGMLLLAVGQVFVYHKAVKTVLGAVLLAVTPAVSFFLTEFYTHNIFRDSPVMKENILWLNLCLFYGLAVVLLLITTHSTAAVTILAGVSGIFGFVNYLALAWRNAPVYPWDILSAGTALSVADNYKLQMTGRLWFIVFTFLFMITMSFTVKFSIKLKHWWINIVAAILALAAFIGLCGYLRSDKAEAKYGYYPYLFSATYLYKYNGTALTMVYTSRYLKFTKPDGYSVNDLEKLYEEYKAESQKTVADSKVRPNVIVIMNEAFSDLSVLGDFTPSEDYMPFIHSVAETEENAVVGKAYASVKGGNTPNSEFEFLTGTPTLYLPFGSIPFQQYIHEDTYSLVSQLEELNYKTVAMHPYAASGWERDEVYDLFGFDEKYFSPAFKGYEKIRGYYSDLGMYKKLIDLYEEKRNAGDASPLFFFGVTMQNHGSYKKVAGFTPTVTVEGLSISNSTNYELASYLTLVKKSDEALEYLVNYFRTVEEPTVILMFGDHQPNDYVVNPILKMNDHKLTSDEHWSYPDRFAVPYVMWANYDTGSELQGVDLGINYLSTALCRFAGLPLSPAQCWLEKLQSEYPIMNIVGVTDKNGILTPTADIGKLPLLDDYAALQYNLVFDHKHTVKGLFSLQ